MNPPITSDGFNVMSPDPRGFGTWLCNHFGGSNMHDDPENCQSVKVDIPNIGTVTIQLSRSVVLTNCIRFSIAGPMVGEIKRQMFDVGATVTAHGDGYTYFHIVEDSIPLGYIRIAHQS